MENTRFYREFCDIKYTGKGACGSVYSATHKLDRQQYAVKIIKFNEEYEREKVLREVKALAKCNHRNVVRYFNAWIEWFVVSSSDEEEDEGDGVGEGDSSKDDDEEFDFSNDDDEEGSYGATTKDTDAEDDEGGDGDGALQNPTAMLFIQMEFCPLILDSLLQPEIKRDSKLSEGEYKQQSTKQALEYFREIVEGLNHIHIKKIIHRDLSRRNIFIDAEGVIKIADFGLAKLLDNSDDYIKSGSSGTKAYLAPEAVKGAPINFKMDVYSLGILFLELLGRFNTESERAYVIDDLRTMGRLPEIENISKYQEYILQLAESSPEERPSTEVILTWPIWDDDDDRVDPPADGDTLELEDVDYVKSSALGFG